MGVRRTSEPEKCGDNSEEATPVPIPNTAVKLLSADDTWRGTARESRSLPLIENQLIDDRLVFHHIWDFAGLAGDDMTTNDMTTNDMTAKESAKPALFLFIFI